MLPVMNTYLWCVKFSQWKVTNNFTWLKLKPVFFHPKGSLFGITAFPPKGVKSWINFCSKLWLKIVCRRGNLEVWNTLKVSSQLAKLHKRTYLVFMIHIFKIFLDLKNRGSVKTPLIPSLPIPRPCYFCLFVCLLVCLFF